MKHRFLILSLCALVLAVALACDSASPVAPTGTVLSVNANPSKINLSGDPAQITVTGFKPDGNPLNPGTQILVSTDLGDLYDAAAGGSLVSTLEISGDGRAITYLRGDGRGGSATVTATLTTGGEATATAVVQVGETTDSRPTLIISANPSVIDVLEVSRIEILGRNSDNTPVGSGQRIRLTSNLGTLHATDAETDTTVISSVDTDANGEAIVFFRAGDQSSSTAGRVSAILGTSAEESVTIEIRDAPADFSFIVDDESIPQGGATIQLTAIVVNAKGEGVSSILVRFNSIGVSGSFSPGPSDLTDSTGAAEVTLTLEEADLEGVTSFQVSATVTIDSQPQEKRLTITVG